MSQLATVSGIALDVKSLIEALSDREVRFNAKLMSRTAKLLRLISNADLGETDPKVTKSDEE
jgi:ethanolamine utilization protein EutP (predicted NTPase)